LEKMIMSSRAVKPALLILYLILVLQVSCKGPYQDKSQAIIWLNVFELSFSASETGPNPAPQTLRVKNTGAATLNYNLSTDAKWISFSPTSGSSTNQVVEHVISVDKTGLMAKQDDYKGTITVSSDSAFNSPQVVNVTLKLSQQPPSQISVNPPQLSFVASVGGANPSAQIIRVKNSGQGTLNYSITDDANWLNVSPASGISTGGENSHTVSVNIGGLGQGTYTANITISDPNAANSPVVVTASLQIGSSLPPTISVSPPELTFSAQKGGANPAQQRIKVRNAGQQTLNYVITDDAAWMSASPGSGSSTGQENSHYVSVNIAGLARGTYSGTITVSSPNATNSPQTVNVSLEITEVSTDNEIAVACSPSSGRTGDFVDIPVTILGNTKEIKAFGLDITYDSAMFDFVSVSPGSLTSSWGAGFAGFLVSPGRARVGGYGGTFSIPVSSSGSIAVLRLKVTCGSCTDGTQSQICIVSFTDDIAGMTTAPGCVTFTYRK
jgi:hypothetical protein